MVSFPVSGKVFRSGRNKIDWSGKNLFCVWKRGKNCFIKSLSNFRHHMNIYANAANRYLRRLQHLFYGSLLGIREECNMYIVNDECLHMILNITSFSWLVHIYPCHHLALSQKKTRKDALLEVVIEKSMYRKFLLNARALIRNCALSRI